MLELELSCQTPFTLTAEEEFVAFVSTASSEIFGELESAAIWLWKETDIIAPFMKSKPRISAAALELVIFKQIADLIASKKDSCLLLQWTS